MREDNTPVVRDLTEPNRPMRIEIQFSELFKNEWTDAFGYTVIDDSKFKDIETIKNLLKILSVSTCVYFFLSFDALYLKIYFFIIMNSNIYIYVTGIFLNLGIL